MICWFCRSPRQTKLLWPLKTLHLQQSFKYWGWFFMTSDSCNVCVKECRVTVATGTSSTDTLDTGFCSQEVLLLFLVLGLLLRISSSWSLSQSLPSCSGSFWPFFMIRVKWLHRATILNDNFHLRLAYCLLKFSKLTTDNLFTMACLGLEGCRDIRGMKWQRNYLNYLILK